MTVINFTVYDRRNGEITGYGQALRAQALLQEQGDRAVILADYPGEGFMVVDGAFVERPRLAGFDKTAIAVGGDVARIVLPDPCAVTIDGVTHTVTGGVLELSAAVPGSYSITINHWPYMPFEETVTCT